MSEWGPLAAPAGTWEGGEGLDVSFRTANVTVAATGCLELFGPVDNGRSTLHRVG